MAALAPHCDGYRHRLPTADVHRLGPELTFLYNDAYVAILGNRHPAALGRPFQQVWSDVWDDIKPLIDRALAGESIWFENLPLIIERNGLPEDTWYTFSYSPIRDDGEQIAGMFCSCIETTAQVLAERRSTAERDRLFEMSRDLFGVATFDGYLKSINPAWSRILDRSDEELLAKPSLRHHSSGRSCNNCGGRGCADAR